jgi:hypothetical protein
MMNEAKENLIHFVEVGGIVLLALIKTHKTMDTITLDQKFASLFHVKFTKRD